MIVTLIKNNEIYEKILPEKVVGRYWLCDTKNGKSRDLICIEAIDNEWYIFSNRKAYITQDGMKNFDKAKLVPMILYTLSINQEIGESYIFCEESNEGRQSFTKLYVQPNSNLTFGNSQEDTIIYNLGIFNGNVFSLTNNEKYWDLKCNNSLSIVYVNGQNAYNKQLRVGDVIFVLGFKMVIGNNYIAINNPSNKVIVKSGFFKEIKSTVPQNLQVDYSNDSETSDFFYRSPRFPTIIKPEEIVIDAVPSKEHESGMPLFLSVAPSMLMGMTAVLTSVTSIMSMQKSQRTVLSVLPSILTASTMLVTAAVFPILTNRYDKKKRKKNEKLRQEKYGEYLETKKKEINSVIEKQKNLLLKEYHSSEQLMDIIEKRGVELWSKSTNHQDFLSAYIGIGDVPAKLKITAEEKKFSIYDDDLKSQVQKIKNKKYVINNAPVFYSFLENKLTGIVGNSQLSLQFFMNVLFEIVTLHGYDELKIAFLGNPNDLKRIDYIRWLPHIWNTDKTLRLIATNTEEIKNVSEYFNKLLEDTGVFDVNEKEEKKILKDRYLILVTDKNMLEQAEFLKSTLKEKDYIGISVVTILENFSNLPRECENIIDIKDGDSFIFTKKSNDIFRFKPNLSNNINFSYYFRKLYNITLNLPTTTGTLPNMITFLEMYKTGKIEYLNVLSRWKENDPSESLKAPVGVNPYGELFYIDLHEKFHGPHGLIAGGTGSGKSEFIITFILSLAINYHPDEVSFVLIDYKGGGLTGAFEVGDSGKKLPHLSGTITNLSGSSIKRCIISIRSELQRRQKVFNEARKISGEGTLDIYKYQKLRRQGIVNEPLPHLYIISDEFAELKSQQPEFMDELISTARIGRSLGVHLILATQKPAGVVDDQIWSNTKFRVCLKVQDKADSMDMIRRPDAAEITQTGRFYFQVGYNELFAMGQSAWSGAEYIPTENREITNSKVIEMIDNNGQVIIDAKQEQKKEENKKYSQQVVEIVKYLANLAEKENIKTLSLWMDPLPSSILLKNLIEKYSYKVNQCELNPIIGEYDDPSTQSQHLLTMPISKEGNCVIYGVVGSGKTTLLSTIIYSLITQINSENLNLYIIDFGSGTLSMFNNAPQVGDVLLQDDSEKVNNLFKYIEKEINDRKKLFISAGGTIDNYRKYSNKSIPNIVIIINNYSIFKDAYEVLDEKIKNITRDGMKYGITFIFTTTDINAIGYSVLQNIKLIYSLQLNSEEDYSVVIGRTDGLYPSALPGRGLVKISDLVYEFQTALLEYSDKLVDQVIKKCKELAEKSTIIAKSIPILPKVVNVDFVSKYIKDLNSVPIGVEKESLEIYKYDCFTIPYKIISSELLKNTYSFTKLFIDVLIKIPNNYVFLFDSSNRLKINIKNKLYIADENSCSSRLNYIYNEYQKRKETYEASGKNPISLVNTFQIVCIFNGYTNFTEQLSFEDKTKLDDMLANLKSIFKISVIFIDEVNNLSNFNIEKWYSMAMSSSSILWIGRGINEQFAIKVNNNCSNEINNDFGYIIEDGSGKLIKILKSSKKDEEEILDF